MLIDTLRSFVLGLYRVVQLQFAGHFMYSICIYITNVFYITTSVFAVYLFDNFPSLPTFRGCNEIPK